MKIAFTYNLRLTDVRETEKEAEYDSADTVNAIAAALEAAGHEVEKIEVSGPATNLLERLEAIDPDIIFNTAEGDRGRMREAFYPALFEELGIPFTGSDAYTNAITLDKWLTKLMVQRAGIDTPRGVLVTPRNFESVLEQGHLQLRPRPRTRGVEHHQGAARSDARAQGCAAAVSGRGARRGVHR